MKTLQGKIVSIIDDKSAVVEVLSTKIHPKYKKRMNRTKGYLVDTSDKKAELNNEVIIVETKPLSKRKRFTIQSVVGE